MNKLRDSKGMFKGKQKVKVVCDNCGKSLLRHPCRLKQAHQFCDSKCHGEYLKTHGNFVKGHKINNGKPAWNKGITTKVKRNCVNCGKQILVTNWKKDDKHLFCGQDCFNDYKIKNHELYYTEKREVKCKQCGDIFYTYSKSSQIFCGVHCKNKWFSNDKKYLEKLRKSKLRYIKKMKNNNLPVMPTVGKYETKILDSLEKLWGRKIERQHPVAGYFLDGYCQITNVAIEIDEQYHKKQIKKDKIREQNIINKIGCSFVRIEVDAHGNEL